MRIGRGVAAVLGALVVAVGLRAFVAAPFRVPSDSMAGTLLAGDYVWVNRLAPVRAGDVAVFRRNDSWHVKRVVATAGQAVAWTGGRLRVDGVDERPPPEALMPWGAACPNGRRSRFVARADDARRLAGACPLTLDTLGDAGHLRVTPGSVFVAGDHRTASEDSRRYGVVSRSDVVGRVSGVYLSRDPRTGAWRWGRIGRLR